MSINNQFSLNSDTLPFFNNTEFKSKFLESNLLLNQSINIINQNRNNINANVNYSKITQNNKLTENNIFLKSIKNKILKTSKSLYLFYYLFTILYFTKEYKYKFSGILNKDKYNSFVNNITNIIKSKYLLNNILEKDNQLSLLLENIAPILPKSANAYLSKLFQNGEVKVYQNRYHIYKDKMPGQDEDSFISLYKESLIQYILYKYSDEEHKKYIPRIYNIYRRKSGSLSPYKRMTKKYVRIKMEKINGITFEQFIDNIYESNIYNRNVEVSSKKVSAIIKIFMLKVLNIMNYFYNNFGLVHHGLKANNIMITGHYDDILLIHRYDNDIFDIKFIDFGKSICNFNYIKNNETHNLKLCGQEMNIFTIDKFIVPNGISNEFGDVFYFLYKILLGFKDIDNFDIGNYLKPLFIFQIVINGKPYTLRNENFFNYGIFCVTYNTLKGYLISLLLNKYNNISFEDIENSNFTTVYHQFIEQFYYRNIISIIQNFKTPYSRI